MFCVKCQIWKKAPMMYDLLQLFCKVCCVFLRMVCFVRESEEVVVTRSMLICNRHKHHKHLLLTLTAHKCNLCSSEAFGNQTVYNPFSLLLWILLVVQRKSCDEASFSVARDTCVCGPGHMCVCPGPPLNVGPQMISTICVYDQVSQFMCCCYQSCDDQVINH